MGFGPGWGPKWVTVGCGPESLLGLRTTWSYVYQPTWSVGKASPQPSTTNKQRMKKMEKLKRFLQKIKNERDELQGILANYTNKDLNNRIKIRTFMLKKQHDQVMTDLKRMHQDISDALYKCKKLTKENQFYCIRHCYLQSESNHLQHKVRMLWKENRQLLEEQIALEECSKESKRLCKEDSLKTNDLCTKQEQVGCINHEEQVAVMSNLKHIQA
ncbi:uncharacterized protein LOC110309690 [Mus caroli]|uniref:Uncharacterized protein LOC110309690 n=1 Tax=Mus caroli TaxID=10089 RepID=A0A6P5QUC8_MUSCR|nr:uncharacterized protein LOC110309690 [Mus caroli]